jgi:hypothetical protein
MESHSLELNKVIKPALLKAGLGVTTTYTVKELTLEQKVSKGIATEQEIDLYQTQLMESL